MFAIKQNCIWIPAMVVWVLLSSGTWVLGQDTVPFSGQVKKVIEKKSKVAIFVPETKKRFTVIINEKTVLSGISGIGDLKKKDSVKGKYVVTDKGLYIATELTRK